MQAYAPNGLRIIGVVETLLATAWIADGSFSQDDGHGLSYDYAGESDMHWDTQEAWIPNGRRMFIDEEKNEWDESQITLKD